VEAGRYANGTLRRSSTAAIQKGHAEVATYIFPARALAGKFLRA
jgi:hypothetical protein